MHGLKNTFEPILKMWVVSSLIKRDSPIFLTMKIFLTEKRELRVFLSNCKDFLSQKRNLSLKKRMMRFSLTMKDFLKRENGKIFSLNETISLLLQDFSLYLKGFHSQEIYLFFWERNPSEKFQIIKKCKHKDKKSHS